MGILEKVDRSEELIRRIDVVYRLGKQDIHIRPLNIFLVLSEEDISIFSEVNAIDKKFEATVTQIDGCLYRINYSRTWGGEKFVSYAHIITSEIGWLIISDERKTSPLEGLLRRLYPNITPAYMKSSNFVGLIEFIEKSLNLVVDIYFMTARRPGEQTLSTFKNITLDQMSDYISKSYLVDKIKIKVMSNDLMIFDCLISRDGTSCFSAGDFTFFKDKILTKFLEIGRQKLNFYEKRGPILEHGVIMVKPVEIQLEGALTPELLKELSVAVEKLSDISVATIHRGNPIFLAHIIDHSDGSVFDISATEKSIFLTPVLETSGASLLRFSEQLCKNFREGVARDYRDKHEEPQLKSFTSG